MLVSCPSCQARFRVDESRLAPNGKKVRCSKCRHVWHVDPPAPVEEPAAFPPVTEPAVAEPMVSSDIESDDMPAEPVVSSDIEPEDTPAEPMISSDIGPGDTPPEPTISSDAGPGEPPSERPEPVLSTGDPVAGKEGAADASGKGKEPPVAGLTGDQRAKLAAAQKKSRRPGGIRFWIKVLGIFILVLAVLALAAKMLPRSGSDLVLQPPADIAPVEAKEVPPSPPEPETTENQ